MSEQTTNLSLPFIMAAQAQKHVTHNEALRMLDALIHIVLEDRDGATPPSNPTEGASYLVADSATGEWQGHDGSVTSYQDGAWVFFEPRAGWIAWVVDEQKLVVFDESEWKEVPGNETIDKLGINAIADNTNRLSINSSALLFNHDGGGVQAKVNKNAVGDTASLLFQDNFSGRAELGIVGDDDFRLKVSANGTDWKESIAIDNESGVVKFPSKARHFTPHPIGGRYYLYSDRRWIFKNSSYGQHTENASSSAGTGSEPSISWAARDCVLRTGDRLSRFDGLLRGYVASEFPGLEWRLIFLTGTPGGGSWNSNAETTYTTIASGTKLLTGPSWHQFEESFTEFVAPKLGFICFVVRSSGVPTITRYCYIDLLLEIFRDE